MAAGIDMDCKSWKEKVFVLRDYICIYMFRLCSGMFGAAAIEKKIDRAIPDYAERKQAAKKR